jgi:hypothetical protein
VNVILWRIKKTADEKRDIVRVRGGKHVSEEKRKKV